MKMGSFSRRAQFLAGKALESALFIVHDCSYSSLDRNIIQDEKNLAGSLQKDFFISNYDILSWKKKKQDNFATIARCSIHQA